MAQARWSAERALILALLSLAAAALLPAHAQSGWRLCNQTSFILEAATGRPEGRGVIVEGWKRLRPGACETVAPAPLRPGVHYIFARSSGAHRGGQRLWTGDAPLCVDPNGSFTVESPASCPSMGLEQRRFQAVRIDSRTSWTTRLREAEPYNKFSQSPLTAGIQRLLSDAGVENGPIDGYLARRTNGVINAFLAERGLPQTLRREELVDILEDVARNRSLEVGMMLCNRTRRHIWAAIARRRSEVWESRGWWGLEAGACVRTIDETLLGSPHYVFAEMDTPEGPRRLLGAATPFCTARSKFAITGASDCEARKYRQELFYETVSPEDGKLVYEFFERSFAPPARAGAANDSR